MRDSRRLIAVGSGFETIASRSSQSRKLLMWGLTNSETFEIAKKNETIFEINTWLGQKKTTPGYTKKDVYYTLAKKDLRQFEVFLEYPGPIKAPVNKDEEIASIKIYNGNEIVETIPVYAAEKVKKHNFLLSLLTSFNYMIWGDA
jgi:D-alanyl-D-alanine carboxypeptidase (penicillin-binding protein 5/6)